MLLRCLVPHHFVLGSMELLPGQCGYTGSLPLSTPASGAGLSPSSVGCLCFADISESLLAVKLHISAVFCSFSFLLLFFSPTVGCSITPCWAPILFTLYNQPTSCSLLLVDRLHPVLAVVSRVMTSTQGSRPVACPEASVPRSLIFV
jgi:hypothetical protein